MMHMGNMTKDFVPVGKACFLMSSLGILILK